MTLLNLLAVSIGIGLVITVLLTEIFGLAAGGLVVPGYVALKMLQPWEVAVTLATAYLAFLVIRTLSGFLVIYGRRRTALTILAAYLLGILPDMLVGGLLVVPPEDGNAVGQASQMKYLDMGVIGYIIPGLIAIWFDRQGTLHTLAGLILTASLVRLTLIVVIPDVISAYELDQTIHRPAFSELFDQSQEQAK